MGLKSNYKIVKESLTGMDQDDVMYIPYFLYVEKDGIPKWVRVFSNEPVYNKYDVLCGLTYDEAVFRADRFVANTVFFESMI